MPLPQLQDGSPRTNPSGAPAAETGGPKRARSISIVYISDDSEDEAEPQDQGNTSRVLAVAANGVLPNEHAVKVETMAAIGSASKKRQRTHEPLEAEQAKQLDGHDKPSGRRIR